MTITKTTFISLIALSGAIATAGLANAAEVTGASGKTKGYSPNSPAIISQHQMDTAKSAMPMLTDISQVPGYGSESGFTSMAFGTGDHPFTTKRVALQNGGKGIPTSMKPYRRTGKLFMTFSGGTFVCTASVIKKGLLVTAAHCVHNFGLGAGGYATAVTFQPARHSTSITFDTWTATDWYVPTSYFDGTDVCTVSGVVCENDIALVVMDTGPGAHAGKEIAEVTELNGIYKNNQGYTDFLGKKAAQLTQLGYPVDHDGGLKMVRTDSLAYQEAPSNVVMGSAQTGGSSGGPWIHNFGKSTSYSGATLPTGNASNRVTAVTSWGFVSDDIKVQGSSRFANNTAYPSGGPSNINSLLDDVCALHPTKC